MARSFVRYLQTIKDCAQHQTVRNHADSAHRERDPELSTAIILAGGESSRLRPLGDKSLQRFMGRSLLARHLGELAAGGYTRYVIVTNPQNAPAIQRECALLDGADCRFVTQPEPLGMGDAVQRALAVVEPMAAVTISQAHDLFNPGFHAALMHQARLTPGTILLAARQMSQYFPGGYLILERAPLEEQLPFPISGIVEKPPPGQEPSTWVTLVAHHIPQAGDLAVALAQQQGGSHGDWYERALTTLLRSTPALAVPHTGATASLKYPWHMLDLMEVLFTRFNPAPQIHPSALIDPAARMRGPVIIDEGARVFAGAAIIGPAYVGRDVVVGNNALIRESMIGAHSVVGFGCEVARSWIGENVWFHTSYVGDSVIDENVTFGYGAVTSNMRLDNHTIKVTVKGERIDTGRHKLGQIVGTGARVGVNAALMPGCVIGRHTLVGPGVVLREDVPDHTRLTVRQELLREHQE